ncbi:MAG: hypothetical protein AB7D49_12275, partial [Arcobacter sp.]|uniref:hypothetical protein n=1 Tax=Arcobacter sp. TaxID=1872629 RepID=UPI003D13B90F
NAVGSDVEVDLTTGGTATRGSDYENTLQYSTDGGTTWLDVPATGKVTLPADGSSVLVKVTVKDDATTEPDETVTLTATTTDSQITTQTATGTGTILDDRGSDNPDVDEDIKANILVSDAGSVKEADGATLTYEVKLSNAVGSDVEVDLTTGGTATRGSDYENTLQYSTDGGTTWLDVPATGKVTLPADGSSILVKVTVIDDAITEPDETVLLTATTINTQITTKTATGTGTILDDRGSDNPDVDEDVPVITIVGSTVSEKESGIATGDKVVGIVSISIDTLLKEDLKITLSDGQEVTIYAGEHTPRETVYVETNRTDDYYKQGTTTYDVSILDISNKEIDITNKKTEIIINDDADPINITITATVTTPKIIDVNTEFDDLTGISISATDTDGNSKEIAVIKGTDHDGFGVYGKTTGGGATAELGNLGNGKSEKIIVDFDKDVNSLDIAFAWRNNTETARVTFVNDNQVVGYAEVTGGGNNTKAKVNYYTPDGELIKSVEAQGGTDRVDLSYTFELPDSNGGLVAFDKVEFTAPSYDDDYLINKIVYKEVVDSDVTDITTDGGKVTFDIQLDENYPPQGTATATVEINGVRYENVTLNATGRATITVNSKDLGDLSKVVIKVIAINGGNYEKVNQVEETFDFTPVLESSDDSITTNEDTPYTLKISDFGDVSVNTKEFKITELPNLESGKLYLLVKQGETIIDKEGNLVTITQDTKIEVYKDQIISLADIGAEKLIFEPTSNSDIDGKLKFQVGDGNGNFSDEYTTAIEIIAVADAPIATINVTKIESSSTSEELIVKVGSTTYDITDILVNKGSYVEVKNIGNNTETSAQNVVVNENLDSNDFLKTSSANNIIVIDGDISGGAKIEPMGGNDFIAILGDLINGTINDSSGIDTLYLGKSSSYYSWTVNAHSGDTGMDGTITQYADEAHTQIVGTLYINNIDGIIFADGHTVGSVEVISTPSTTVDYEVDISAALVDLDGSETLTVTITNVPNGATLSSDSYTLTDNGNNTWSVTIPAGTKSITSTITMTVPESESDNINLGITARATETNDNTDGLNYAETVDTDALVYGIDETNNFVFGKATTNLVVTLDVSGSMANNVKDSSGNYVTRFEIAVDSMIKTIKAYKANGTTEVNLTLFGDGAKNIGWMSADSAIDYLNKLTLTSNSIKYNGSSISGISTGGTDYYNALVKTMSVDFTGHEADNTVSYFLSDGAPNKNTSYTDSDNDNIIKTWKTYVSNNIDTLNVIGVGSGAKVDPLKIIQVQDGDKVIMVTDDSTLGDILLGTVTATIIGDVSDNSYFGDGKITINSIVIDGVEYTKTTFPTDGIALDGDGKLSFDFDTGKYNYNAKSSEFSSDITKSFSVNASDEDGDKTTFDVNIKVDVGDKEVVNTLNISGEDIDLTSIIFANKSVDVINLENSSKDKITIELNDVLVQEDKQLVIKGDKGDLIELDTPNDWANTGKEQLDGVNYNVYKGIGTNSTIKLLIEDDIDVNPDI